MASELAWSAYFLVALPLSAEALDIRLQHLRETDVGQRGREQEPSAHLWASELSLGVYRRRHVRAATMTPYEEMQALMLRINDSLTRGKGNCGVSRSPTGKFTLAAGAPTAVGVKRGTIVTLGLSRERLIELRDEIDNLIAADGHDTAASESRFSHCLEELRELERDHGGFILILKPENTYRILVCGDWDTEKAAKAVAAFDKDA
jgi:hypothetical protein